jgi:hypothetical protein
MAFISTRSSNVYDDNMWVDFNLVIEYCAITRPLYMAQPE